MIPLLVPILLVLPLEARFVNSPLAHISDSLKLKCDALPYRTAYIGTRCYFAVSKEVKYSEASALCSSIFPGSKVANNVANGIYTAMMIEKSKFHTSKDSSGTGVKQSICIIESGYKCSVGEQSSVIPGKCVVTSDVKTWLDKAGTYCSRQGMELPSIGNELENKMIRGAIGTNPVWIRNFYNYGIVDRKWRRDKYYSKFSTCSRSGLVAGREIDCRYGQSSVMDKAGHWGNAWERDSWANTCVKDADNAFTPGNKPCIAHHELDEETGLCECNAPSLSTIADGSLSSFYALTRRLGDWTGPKDACLQVIDYRNLTLFLEMPNFPKETYRELNLVHELGGRWNDVAAKVIVRRGCMYSGFGGNGFEKVVIGNNDLGYGEHNIPCYAFGEGLNEWGDGLSVLKCFCDPTEATLNDHVPSPPPKKKCVEHHVFDETTQQCEWKHDARFCGELISNDGRRQMIEIPDWPKNRKYDFDHWNNATLRAANFHQTITEVIVRQHCWVTLKAEGHAEGPGSRRTLVTAGYGKHQVRSYYNGHLGSPNEGTRKVVCECLH